MKIKATVLQVIRDGNLVEAKVLGGPDDSDRRTSVTYYDVTDLNALREALRGRAESVVKHYVSEAAIKEQVTFEEAAWDLPRRLGNTTVEIVSVEIDV